MCDSCYKILGKFVKVHESKFCPLVRSKFCTFCSSYGHTSLKCNKDKTYRETEYNESLSTNNEPSKYFLDYVDEPKSIRALLKAYGELPKKTERDKDKYKKQLIKMSKNNNLVLVPHKLEKNDIIQLDE